MLLTIGIAAYNAEQTIKRCLDSIISNEALFNYEIIIVNDGSKDKTHDIVQEYLKSIKNIIYISNDNMGIAETRNIILDKARGKYLWYIDSDDTIEKNSFFELQKLFVRDANIYSMFFCNIVDKGKRKEYNTLSDCPKEYYPLNINLEMSNPKVNKSILLNSYSVWLYIFNVQFIRENNIRFISNHWYEDLMMIPKVIMISNEVCFFSKILYNYYLTENSIMRNIDNEEKRSDIISVLREIRRFSVEKGLYLEFKDELDYLYTIHYHAIYNNIFSINNNSHVLKYLSSSYRKDVKNIKNKYFNCLSKKEKLVRYLERYNFRKVLKVIKKK